MSNAYTQSKEFVGFEYKEMPVSRGMESVMIDGYMNFGWQLEGTAPSVGNLKKIILRVKRDRKIMNKGELTRLQRQFEAAVSEIEALEFSKVMKASTAAYIIGVIGTAFMAGSVFAFTAGFTLPSVILALPAFAGWIAPYWVYRSIRSKKTAEVTPIIEQKYDDIYSLCESANNLLDK